jgi:ribosomal protein S18 acetylase RimI-like enzyme
MNPSRPEGAASKPPSEPSAPVRVRPAQEEDLEAIAEIGSEAFRGLRPPERGRDWVRACWRAAPRLRYWVAEKSGRIEGYILWMEKGGFREEAVVELEQIAVRRSNRGQGIGSILVKVSLRDLEEGLRTRGSRLKLVEVTTGTDQGAVEFYRRNLGAEIAATIPDFFHGDEVILVARR